MSNVRKRIKGYELKTDIGVTNRHFHQGYGFSYFIGVSDLLFSSGVRIGYFIRDSTKNSGIL